MTAITIDTETTGLSPHTHRLVEIAIIDWDTGAELLHTRIDPQMPIPADATAIHHITDDMVIGAPKFVDIADRVTEIISGVQAVIGYNPWFDRGMISGEYRRLPSVRPPRWPVVICAKRQWDIHEPKEQRKLENAYKRFVDKNGFSGAHSAIADARATREVLISQIFTFGLEGKPWPEFDPDQKRWVGPSDHIIAVDGVLYVNFGQHSGKPAHEVEIGYWRWITTKDFPEHVKTIADFVLIRGGVVSADDMYGFAYGRFL